MSVIFDQLRISDDGKGMYIDVHVNEACYFKDVFLDSITIMTADKISETDPGRPTKDYIYQKIFDCKQKEAHLVLTKADFDWVEKVDKDATKFKKLCLSSTLFFVYVEVKGVPDEHTPCTLDEKTTVAVTFDETMFYQKVMQYTRELADTCKVSKNFLDMILLWNGFKAAVETEHWLTAVDFWRKLFFGYPNMPVLNGHKPCGCHG